MGAELDPLRRKPTQRTANLSFGGWIAGISPRLPCRIAPMLKHARAVPKSRGHTIQCSAIRQRDTAHVSCARGDGATKWTRGFLGPRAGLGTHARSEDCGNAGLDPLRRMPCQRGGGLPFGLWTAGPSPSLPWWTTCGLRHAHTVRKKRRHGEGVVRR